VIDVGHVGFKDILIDARRYKYGIPCLLAGNMEMIVGEIMAAEEKQSPLIIAYNALVTPKIPMELAIPFMVKASEMAKVPVATILDHGLEFDAIIKSMKLGLSSVMFDGSECTYEENIRKTGEIAKIAHALGVSVEGELGSMGGSVIERGGASSEDSVFTDPERVAEYVERTGIDALAISFGSVHGPYRGKPNLDIERLKKIYNSVSLPLVMHGASGLSDYDYRLVIENGISKENYYTVN